MRLFRHSFPGLTALVLLSPPAVAQTPHWGFLLGPSIVGGANSRAIVTTPVGPLTGADQTGFHARLFLDLPLSTEALAFRLDLFYNRLTSDHPTYSVVNGATATAAAIDRTLGATGTLLVAPFSAHRLSPYFSTGVGLFRTRLEGYIQSNYTTVTHATATGMGLGVTGGLGLAYRLDPRVTLLLDWRYHQGLYNTRGTAFMPLSVGVRF